MNIITRKEAIEQRLAHYFTGKPCKHGHHSPRAVSSGTCLACASLASKTRFAQLPPEKKREAWNRQHERNRNNPERVERIAKYQAEYRKRHSEHLKKYRKRYAEANKEKLAAQKQRYYQDNKTKLNTYRKQYTKTHPDKTVEWEKKSRSSAIRDLRDSYVKSVLTVSSPILKHADIPPLLVEVKRENIKIKRLLRSHENKSPAEPC